MQNGQPIDEDKLRPLGPREDSLTPFPPPTVGGKYYWRCVRSLRRHYGFLRVSFRYRSFSHDSLFSTRRNPLGPRALRKLLRFFMRQHTFSFFHSETLSGHLVFRPNGGHFASKMSKYSFLFRSLAKTPTRHRTRRCPFPPPGSVQPHSRGINKKGFPFLV